MSYCVQCGVELAASEKSCPLCGTRVYNPNAAQSEQEDAPYPHELEHVAAHMDRKYGLWLSTLLLALPMAVTLLVDLLTSGSATWSLYVLGAGVFIWMLALLPLWRPMNRPYVFIALDIAICALYLLLIWQVAGGDRWYLHLALPLTMALGLFGMSCVFVKRRKRVRGLLKPAWMILLGAAVIVLLEIIIDDFLWESVSLGWSLYTALSLLSVSTALRIVEKKQRLKESIRKRLFI